jgi:hypothetical protein
VTRLCSAEPELRLVAPPGTSRRSMDARVSRSHSFGTIRLAPRAVKRGGTDDGIHRPCPAPALPPGHSHALFGHSHRKDTHASHSYGATYAVGGADTLKHGELRFDGHGIDEIANCAPAKITIAADY